MTFTERKKVYNKLNIGLVKQKFKEKNQVDPEQRLFHPTNCVYINTCIHHNLEHKNFYCQLQTQSVSRNAKQFHYKCNTLPAKSK